MLNKIKRQFNFTHIIIRGLIFSMGFVVYSVNEKYSEKQVYTQTKEEVKTAALIDIENFARQNARYLAKWIGDCINEQILNKGIKDENSMIPIVDYCWKSHRSGWTTWDYFVINLTSWHMFTDNSTDCLKGWEGRECNPQSEEIYLKNNEDKWECWMHQDRLLCIKTLKSLYNIKTTDASSRLFWNYDGSIEWLEAVTIPTNTDWYFGPAAIKWIKNENNIQLMVVVWTQSDEVFAQFNNSFNTYEKNKVAGETYIDDTFNSLFNLTILFFITVLFTAYYVKREKDREDEIAAQVRDKIEDEVYAEIKEDFEDMHLMVNQHINERAKNNPEEFLKDRYGG